MFFFRMFFWGKSKQLFKTKTLNISPQSCPLKPSLDVHYSNETQIFGPTDINSIAASPRPISLNKTKSERSRPNGGRRRKYKNERNNSEAWCAVVWRTCTTWLNGPLKAVDERGFTFSILEMNPFAERF